MYVCVRVCVYVYVCMYVYVCVCIDLLSCDLLNSFFSSGSCFFFVFCRFLEIFYTIMSSAQRDNFISSFLICVL